MKKTALHDILRTKFHEAFEEIDKTEPMVYVQIPEGFCVFTKTPGYHVEKIFHVTPFVFLFFAGDPNDILDVRRAFENELSDFLHYASLSDVTDRLVLLRVRAILKERFEKQKKPAYSVTGLVLDLRRNDLFLFYPNGDYEVHTEPCVILGNLPNEETFTKKLQTFHTLKDIFSLVKKSFKKVSGIPEEIQFTYERKRA